MSTLMDLPPFQTFLEEQRVAVYRFLLATVGPGAADDCFQETFLSALRAYPDLREASNLRGWVMTIATRKAMDHWRRERRRPVPMDELPERATPERADAEPAIWDAVRRLPPAQRAAVVHRYVLDLPYAEIAVALGCSCRRDRGAIPISTTSKRRSISPRLGRHGVRRAGSPRAPLDICES